MPDEVALPPSPRWPGMAPPLVVEQVRNTAPYIFTDSSEFSGAPHLAFLQAACIRDWPLSDTPDLAEYFILLASAHYATVATFVPTDLDNSVRLKLWSAMNQTERSRAGRWVLESRHFDFSHLSGRWVAGPDGRTLQGHLGEWFSMAVAAYASNRRGDSSLAEELAVAIRSEIQNEQTVFEDIFERREGLDLLRAATLIAHNLGDLDRVYEAWGLERYTNPIADLCGLGQMETSRDFLLLGVAGELNKMMMAKENHRHFCLRRPRAIRRLRDLLLPIGPFFDDWGSQVASHSSLSLADIGEVTDALIDGWFRVGGYGYARALSGIESTLPGGLSTIAQVIPARSLRLLKTGQLRMRISEERWRFERRWGNKAVELVSKKVNSKFSSSSLEKPTYSHRNRCNTGKETAQSVGVRAT